MDRLWYGCEVSSDDKYVQSRSGRNTNDKIAISTTDLLTVPVAFSPAIAIARRRHVICSTPLLQKFPSSLPRFMVSMPLPVCWFSQTSSCDRLVCSYAFEYWKTCLGCNFRHRTRLIYARYNIIVILWHRKLFQCCSFYFIT